MAYQSLYRKYRPQNFSDVVGQGHVVRTLQNAIVSGRVAHGYLFTGTRGTAKTTIARLLAKAVNCESSDRPVAEPCNQCAACKSITAGASIDVIEMDAASHRGVADIEEVRKSVGFGPMELRYKVFIIDEAHQLSSDAKDAFLKTLEEPPANVVFILATTEPQSIPITIRSRCQQFDFKRGSLAEIASRLRYVLDCEGVSYTPDAINLVARGAEGSYRDSLSLLEQVLAFAPTRITGAEVNTVLGTLDADMLGQVVQAVARRDAPTAFALAGQLLDAGKEARTLLRTLSGHFRDLLLVSVGGPAVGAELSPDEVGQLQAEAQAFTPQQMMRAMDILNEAQGETRWNNQHRLLVELTFLKLMNLGDGSELPLVRAPIVFATAPTPVPAAPQPMPKVVVEDGYTPAAPLAPPAPPARTAPPVPMATPVATPIGTPSTPVAAPPPTEEEAPVLSGAFFAPDAAPDEDDELLADNSEAADEDTADDTDEADIETPPITTPLSATASAALFGDEEDAEPAPEIDTSPGLFEDSPVFANAAPSTSPASPVFTAPTVTPSAPAPVFTSAPAANSVALVEDNGPTYGDEDVPPLDDAAPAPHFAVGDDDPVLEPVKVVAAPPASVPAAPSASDALFDEEDVPVPTFDLDAVYRAWPQMLDDAGRISKKAQLMLVKAQPSGVRGHTVDVAFGDRASLEMMSPPKQQEFVRKLLSRALGAPKLAVHFALSPDVAPLPPRQVEKKKQRIDILDAVDQLSDAAPSFGSSAPYPSFGSAPSATFGSPTPAPRPMPAAPYAPSGVSSAIAGDARGGAIAPVPHVGNAKLPPVAAYGGSRPAPAARVETYHDIDGLDEGEVYHPAMAHPLMQDVLQLFGGRILTDK